MGNLTQRWAVVMAGGSGTRFWPLSRRAKPKQVLELSGREPLLSQTLTRLAGVVADDQILVVTATEPEAAVRKCLDGRIAPEQILVEPEGKNTAACLAWATLHIQRCDPSALIVALPADHFIPDDDAFRRDLEDAFRLANTGAIVTFGVMPTRPETGFGYLRLGEPHPDGGRAVLRFVEKPDPQTAERLVADGEHRWNCGIFCFSAVRMIDELRRWLPNHLQRLTEAVDANPTERTAALQSAYADLAAISIDVGVMERTDRIAAIEARFPWNDVGSWEALLELTGGSSAVIGDVVEIDGTGNVLVSNGTPIVTLGIQDLVVVQTNDAILVCPVGEAQRVKEVVAALGRQGKSELL